MWASRVLRVYVYVLFAVMLVPILIVVPAALTATSYMTFPPKGLTLDWFVKAIQDEYLIDSLVRSLELAAISTGLVVFVALLVSFAIERKQFRGKILLETFFTGPRVIPLIIFVLALMIFYHAIGLSETFLGLALSHLVITFPFAFRTILASISSLDVFLEWSAKTLGANWFTVLFRVILPQMKTALIAAFMFAFITSFNNVTMALFLTAPGERTLPVELFQRLNMGGITPKVPAFSVILAVVGLALFFVLDRTVGVFKYMAGGGGD